MERSAEPARRSLRVAAAADLKFALDELVGHFAQEAPELDVLVTYGSSGNFHAQLLQRAPFDLYFSADIEYPHRLIEAGIAEADSLFEYAVGRIVIWVRHRSPIDVTALGSRALLDASIHKIAIANPTHAPYGRAAEAALRDLGIHDTIADRLVLGENITQAAQFIDSGSADIGIIALSLAVAPQMRDRGRYWEIPRRHFDPMVQGGVIPSHARNPQDAGRLRDFVISPRGREVLRSFGFFMPGE